MCSMRETVRHPQEEEEEERRRRNTQSSAQMEGDKQLQPSVSSLSSIGSFPPLSVEGVFADKVEEMLYPHAKRDHFQLGETHELQCDPLVLANNLLSDCSSERLEAIQNLHIIGQVIGEQKTRDELLPFLLAFDEENDDVLYELAGVVRKLLACVGGPPHVEALFPFMMELLALKDTLLRKKAVESFQEIVRMCGDSAYMPLIVAKLHELADSAADEVRMSFCDLLPVCIEVLQQNSQISQRRLALGELTEFYFRLCEDDVALVRRAAAQNLPGMIRALSKKDPEGFSLSVPIERLRMCAEKFTSTVEQEQIRILGVYACEALCEVDETVRCTVVIPTLHRLGSDPSWRVRCVVAEQIPNFGRHLDKGVFEKLVVPIFKNILSDGDMNVKSVALSKLSDVLKCCSSADDIVQVMGDQVWSQDTESESPHVKMAVAEALKTLPSLITQESTIHYLLPVIIRMLRDPSPEVRIKVLEGVPSLANTIDIATMKEALIPCLKGLFDVEDENWRTRMGVVQLLPLFVDKLGMKTLEESGLWQFLSITLQDKVHIVRETAGETLTKLAQKNGLRWTEEYILPELEGLRCSLRYTLRVDAIAHAANMMKTVGRRFVEEHFLQKFFIDMRFDKVPNVRFNVAKALLRLKLEFPGDDVNGFDTRECLSQLLKDEDEDVRYYSYVALTGQDVLPKYVLPPLSFLPPVVDGY